ncbi:response regulator, partial [Achromobacter ruhlandii]|uniref:response regulator n=2 Tax=Achromobacter ruhlandii TaxID=72557 RepID=UPI0022B8FD73
MRVAFIDDDEDLRRANVQTLKLHGLTVDAHASARSALATLNRDFDGVVVTDIRMPDIELPRVLRRLQPLREWSPYEQAEQVF